MPTTALEVAPRQQPKIFSFAPTNFTEALAFCERLAISDIVPKQYKGKPADILVAIQYGAEVGLQPMQALNSICVINGRPGLYGDGFLGIILSQPDCIDVEEMDFPEILAKGSATCTIKRRGRKPVTKTFTLAMAQTAGLTTKDGPWKQYVARQLQMRARGFAGRDAYADVLRGIKTVEELLDYNGQTIEAEGPYRVVADMPPLDEPITQDEARAFGDAWKKSGWRIDDAKAHLLEKFGIQSSLKLKKSQYAAAMAWANKTDPGTGTPAANGNGKAIDEKQAHNKQIVFELFKILAYDAVKQAEAIKSHSVEQVTDWEKLAWTLNKELPTEG